MKKILVLLTGGTIGSASPNGVIDLEKEGSAVIGLYLAGGGREVSFDAVRLIDMLSENAGVSDFVRIANALAEVDCGLYDGIIIAYGTDTLAYAANFTAMAQPAYPLTVVFVSSDKPLDEPGANGLDNFSGAVDFILNAGQNGVYAVYKNRGENTRVHFGSRLLQAEALTGEVRSAAGVFFGEIKGGIFARNPDAANPAAERISKKKKAVSGVLAGPTPYVLYIKSCPGADLDVYDIARTKPSAAVIELYHSGTACVKGAKGNTADFITRCTASGIPVVLASYPYQDGRRYRDSELLEKAGGIYAVKMSAEAAYAKTLIYFLSKSGEGLCDFINKDLFFEIVERL